MSAFTRVLISCAVFGVGSFPERATAQACCTATGSGKVGLVAPEQRAAVAVELSWERAFGSHGADGRYARLRQVHADDGVAAIGGGYRVVDDLQVHASVPLRLQRRSFAGETAQYALRPGDSSVGARALLAHDPMPAHGRARLGMWEVGLLAKLPTGRGPNEALQTTGVDATGDGAHQLGAVTDVVLRLPRTHWLEFEGGYSLRLPSTARGRRIDPGDELFLSVGYAHVPSVFFAMGAQVSARFTRSAKEGAMTVPDSASRRVRPSLFGRWALDYPSWAVLASLASDLPIHHLGRNVPYAGTTFSIGVQRSFTR